MVADDEPPAAVVGVDAGPIDDKEPLLNHSTDGDGGGGGLSTATINMSPKEAYFELLRVWVTQANLAHNAHAFFPFYMMANYPQLMMDPSAATGQFQQSQQHLPAAAGGNGPLHNLLGMHFGIPAAGGGAAAAAQPNQPQQPQLFQRFAMNMFNRNRGARRDEMFDSQARSEESRLNYLVPIFVIHNCFFFWFFDSN